MLHDTSVLVRSDAPRAIVSLVLAVLCVALSPLAAQDKPVYTQPGTDGAKVQTMHPFQDALVFGANKTAWQLVWRELSATDRRLSLFKSTDAGNTWPLVPCLELPTSLDGRGSIAMGADCKTLSVVWDARDPDPAYSSVHYGEVDTTTCLWSCGPTLLATGTSSSNFWAMDVESTLGGRVAVAYMRSYSGSQNTWFNGNWSSTIRVKQPGACNPFGPGQAINTGAYAVNANMVAIGDDVHIVYRTAYGGYGISYRGFDTRSGLFLDAADVPIGPNDNLDMHASNVAVIATDNSWARECKLACLHVIYATGDYTAGNGEVWRAWANVATAGTNLGWNRTLVMSRPELLGGNQNYYHYTLATGEDRAVYAVFTRKIGLLTSIEAQRFVCGTAYEHVGLFPTTSGVPGINGHRGSHTTAKLHFMISRQGNPEGVWMWRARGFDQLSGRARTVAYGRACELAGKQPTLRSHNTPTIGGPPLVLESSGFVNGNPAVLMAGTTCTSVTLGSSCWILQDMLLTLPVAPVTGCGQTVTSLVVPDDSSLIGVCLYLQAAQYAPSLNPGSDFILTNGLAAILDK